MNYQFEIHYDPADIRALAARYVPRPHKYRTAATSRGHLLLNSSSAAIARLNTLSRPAVSADGLIAVL